MMKNRILKVDEWKKGFYITFSSEQVAEIQLGFLGKILVYANSKDDMPKFKILEPTPTSKKPR